MCVLRADRSLCGRVVRPGAAVTRVTLGALTDGCILTPGFACTHERLQASLQRQMERSTREFTDWKRQRDRELLQLKKQGRLNAAQLQKVEALHSKQQAVLRRKMGGCCNCVVVVVVCVCVHVGGGRGAPAAEGRLPSSQAAEQLHRRDHATIQCTV